MSGIQDNFVDTQDVSLTNNTNAVTYTQLENVRVSKRHNKSFHQLTDNLVDKNFSLTDVTIEGDIVATNPELALLKTLSTMVNAQLPLRSWTVSYTDQSGTVVDFTGDGYLAVFDAIDNGESAVTWHFVLEMRSVV
jgi:hypothetical protein